MKLFRGFAVAGAILAFAIALIGSWVRINEAGLTCPDWPLCHGRLVPALGGGVILEWTHRLSAFVEGFVVLGALLAGFSVRSRIAGVTPALGALGLLFALQVALGGATVLLANSPLSVTLHWATGMALVATLTALAVLAVVAPRPGSRFTGSRTGAALALASSGAFITMCAGAFVSSSHAGLACPAFPACGAAPAAASGAQVAQMVHRSAAFAFAGAAAFATFLAWRHGSPRVRAFALGGMGLLVAQVALGAANVAWLLPAALRELHAANAGATFVAFVIATLLATLERREAPERGLERRPAAHRVTSSA